MDDDCEAIPERDPAYELPAMDEPTVKTSPLTDSELKAWVEMIRRRPSLAALNQEPQ